MLIVCYIHVPNDADHGRFAQSYVAACRKHPPECEHRNVIICQGKLAQGRYRKLFDSLGNTTYLIRGGEGRDIGGYMDAARQIKEGVMLCMGGSSTVRRAGWGRRMLEAWEKHGPGFYGSLSSFQVRPHLNTTGFWTSPELLLSYPGPIVSTPDRYEFEHGKGCLWWRLNQRGIPTKLVTWCGEYDWPDWRKPQNIICRGDQSNCLTYFRLNYSYESDNPQLKADLEYLFDRHVLDEDFKYPNWTLPNQVQT